MPLQFVMSEKGKRIISIIQQSSISSIGISNMPLQFVMSEKGKRKLLSSGHFFYKERQRDEKISWRCEHFQLSSGHFFYKERQRDEKISWRCEHFQKFKCPARVTTVGDEIVKVGKDHNQVGDAAQVEAAKIYDSIRTSAILIFFARRNLQLLSQSDHWYADGTFKTVPLLFNQLHTIHGLKKDASVPLVYALLPNRSKETYEHLLRQLTILQPVLSPRTITEDFEKPMITLETNFQMQDD
ncbi:FLYWCH zinc finger domain [Popillia japonica]|uniref:FLYWCH zinc finger domain n=1 Tax=Popillia japonica TaxID=7064 RepID=A0AAW1LQS9_POPJA